MTSQSIWLLCEAVSILFAQMLPMRPSFAVMASTGLLALAFEGTAFGRIMFAMSALAALVDMVLLLVATVRGIRS